MSAKIHIVPQLPISPHKSAKKSARTQRPHSDFSFSLTKFSIFLIFFFFLINHLERIYLQRSHTRTHSEHCKRYSNNSNQR